MQLDAVPCPWSYLTPDPTPVCERALCALIVQPCNTWTNIGYLIVSLLIWNNKKLGPNRYFFGFTIFLLSIGSTLFHMTGTLLGKQIDVGTMILLSSLGLTFTIRRFFSLSPAQLIYTYLGLALSALLVMGNARGGTVAFMLHVLLIYVLELKFAKRNEIAPEQTRLLVRSLILFLIALVFNILDQKHILCIPDNHIMTGHGIWHLMAAYCIWLIARYYCLTCQPDWTATLFKKDQL